MSITFLITNSLHLIHKIHFIYQIQLNQTKQNSP